ncbi:MAG: hypothetical protein P8X53_08625 [Chromatiales bacterium]
MLHNLAAGTPFRSCRDPLDDRSVSNAVAQQFRELAVRQGRYSTDMLDEWLAGHEADTDYPHGNMLHRAGVGVYYFEVENDGDGD